MTNEPLEKAEFLLAHVFDSLVTARATAAGADGQILDGLRDRTVALLIDTHAASVTASQKLQR